jgi:hypothetical protein
MRSPGLIDRSKPSLGLESVRVHLTVPITSSTLADYSNHRMCICFRNVASIGYPEADPSTESIAQRGHRAVSPSPRVIEFASIHEAMAMRRYQDCVFIHTGFGHDGLITTVSNRLSALDRNTSIKSKNSIVQSTSCNLVEIVTTRFIS